MGDEWPGGRRKRKNQVFVEPEPFVIAAVDAEALQFSGNNVLTI